MLKWEGRKAAKLSMLIKACSCKNHGKDVIKILLEAKEGLSDNFKNY